MPLRVKGFKPEPDPEEEDEVIEQDSTEVDSEPTTSYRSKPSNTTPRQPKRHQPSKLHKSVRERAGVTWTAPPSALAAECERAIREPNFPNDVKGQRLKILYGDLTPLGLKLFEELLLSYWSDNPRMLRGCSQHFLHRLRNAGIKGVGYTSRPNEIALEAIAPFCYVPLSELYRLADELTVTRNKYTEQVTDSNLAHCTDMSNYFVFLLQDAVRTYGNSPQALAIHLNVGIYSDEPIITEEVIIELLQGRQPTHHEIAELAKVIHHPITRKPDPEWLYSAATRTNSNSTN